jgi:hypothetical protein
MIFKVLKLDRGQTVVEYMLMIAMSVGLGIAVFNQLNDYLIKNPNGLVGARLNQFKKDLSSDSSGRYKRFPIKLPK